LKSRYTGTTFINGIINNGGKDINIIPGEANCMFMIKSPDKETMESVCEELISCARFAA
jgi:metal-dependent amidase/aminoacylase/carboxypeptidase family protein